MLNGHNATCVVVIKHVHTEAIRLLSSIFSQHLQRGIINFNEPLKFSPYNKCGENGIH